MTPEQQNIAANLEGTRTPEELAENFRELNRIAPTPADRFKLMFSAMNDLPANLPPLPPVPPKMSDCDVWHMPCARCGFDPGKSGKTEVNTCWKCGNRLYRDLSDRALKRPIEAVRDEPAKCDHCGGSNIVDDCAMCGAPQCCHDCCAETTRELLESDEPAKDEPEKCPFDTDGDGNCHKCFRRPGGCFYFDEPATGTEARACEDALKPFRNVARGIPDNWPGECILRFDQREDGTIFLAYHGVNDASGGITIDQWRALLQQPPEEALARIDAGKK